MSILAKRGRLSPWGWSSKWLWVSHYGAENEAQVLKEREVLPHHPPPLLLVNTIQLASDRPVETTRATTWLLHVWLWWNLYVCLQQMSSCHLLRQSKAGLSWVGVAEHLSVFAGYSGVCHSKLFWVVLHPSLSTWDELLWRDMSITFRWWRLSSAPVFNTWQDFGHWVFSHC